MKSKFTPEQRKERALEAQRKWRAANKELAAARVRASVAKKRDYYNKKAMDWKKNNPEKVKASKSKYLERKRCGCERKSKLTKEEIAMKNRERVKSWRIGNPDKAKAASKLARQKKPEKYRELARAWVAQNAEKVKAIKEAYVIRNPHKVKESKRRSEIELKSYADFMRLLEIASLISKLNRKGLSN